jgi:anthranilate synthase component II
MNMVLLIDNHDSFVYNLYQMVGTVYPDVRVCKNDAITLEEIASLAPTHLILSPGPGRPKEAGICEAMLDRFKGQIPILGVCLGHQAICEVFGGEITYARQLLHGKSSSIHIANGNPIFKGLPPIIEAGRYHSLSADRKTLPDELLIIAEDSFDEIMGVRHRQHEIYGVQFHPESVLTPFGKQIIENFLGIEEGVKR